MIHRLRELEKRSETIPTMVPLQVLVDIDNSRNPMTLTKDRLERAATENQFMNGKIHAIDVRHRWLFVVPVPGVLRGGLTEMYSRTAEHWTRPSCSTFQSWEST